MKYLLLSGFVYFFMSSLQAQEYAKTQLENSPRHHEWIEIGDGERKVKSFVAYPEKAESTPVVIVIHENRGLNDWARSFTDQIAAAGYLAIAPDMLSGFSEEHSSTASFATSDDARSAIYELDANQVMEDLDKVVAYAKQASASSGEVVVIGFCWGGSQAFRFATHNKQIEASMVFYGSAPNDSTAYKSIHAPVYGFYGENDQRINSGIPEAERLMEKYDKTYKYEIYPGAGHAFMRYGDDPEKQDANTEARDKAWERLKKLLGSIEREH